MTAHEVAAAVDAVPDLTEDERLLEVAARLVNDLARRHPRLVDLADTLTEAGVLGLLEEEAP